MGSDYATKKLELRMCLVKLILAREPSNRISIKHLVSNDSLHSVEYQIKVDSVQSYAVSLTSGQRKYLKH